MVEAWTTSYLSILSQKWLIHSHRKHAFTNQLKWREDPREYGQFSLTVHPIVSLISYQGHFYSLSSIGGVLTTHFPLDLNVLHQYHHYLVSIHKAPGPTCLSCTNAMTRHNQFGIDCALNTWQPQCVGPGANTKVDKTQFVLKDETAF